MAAHVEYFTDRSKQHRFRVVAANGEVVHSSEAYTTDADARRGFSDLCQTIDLVRRELRRAQLAEENRGRSAEAPGRRNT